MKKIFNYVSKFLLIVSFSLFLSLDVYALQNVKEFNGFTISDKGMFYDNSNDTTTSQVGYSIEPFTYRNVEYYNAMNTKVLTTVNGGYGGSIAQCGLSFVSGGYYSMTYYFGSSATGDISYSPTFSRKTYKLGLSNNLSGSTSFNYDVTEYGENVYSFNNFHVAFYTVIFKAPTTATCITSAFSTNPTYTHNVDYNMLSYLGYNFEYLGDKPLTSDELQSALQGQFNGVNDKINQVEGSINSNIDQMESSINSNIDGLKEKQDETNNKLDEQNETSKGIWGSLKEGISNIGKWFGDLTSSIGNFFADLASSIGNFFADLASNIGGFFSDLWGNISSLFFGEEVCEDGQENLFKGFDGDIYGGTITKLEDGWYQASTGFSGWYVSAPNVFQEKKDYNVFIEIKDVSYTATGSAYVQFAPFYYNTANNFRDNSNLSMNTQKNMFYAGTNSNINSYKVADLKDGIFNYKMTYIPRTNYAIYTYIASIGGSTFNFKFRYFITDDMSITLDNYEYYDTKQECSTSGGLFGMISNFMSNVGKWFTDLLSGIIEGIKGLFVPTDDQLYEIVNDSKDLTENFGFVGESMAFFINIFTSLLGLANHNGCVELPEFSIGQTSLFDEYVFWEARNVCLSDNSILSSNIDTIRSITSIVLVCMFINFAASKFFNILSKNDNNQASNDAYNVRHGV